MRSKGGMHYCPDMQCICALILFAPDEETPQFSENLPAGRAGRDPAGYHPGVRVIVAVRADHQLGPAVIGCP